MTRSGLRYSRRDRLPKQLLAHLENLDPTTICKDQAAACAMDTFTGSYLLVVHLRQAISIARRAATVEIEPGWHIYSGSAYGRGGVRARVLRHFRPAKKVHWHIDHLTNAGTVAAALAFVGGSECSIVERLAAEPLFKATVTDFGISDCSNCASHLLSYRSLRVRAAGNGSRMARKG